MRGSGDLEDGEKGIEVERRYLVYRQLVNLVNLEIKAYGKKKKKS